MLGDYGTGMTAVVGGCGGGCGAAVSAAAVLGLFACPSLLSTALVDSSEGVTASSSYESSS